MAYAYPASADAKTIKALDMGVLAWAVVWLALAFVTAQEVRSLRQLSTTLVRSSDVLADTADVLASIEDVPVLGSRVAEVQGSVRDAAESTRESGLGTRDNIEDLALLLGVLIFLVPLLPVLFLYLPLRLSWRREVATIAAGAASSGDDPAFKDFLARRAVNNVGFERLEELGIRPWDALPAERRDELAREELARLGIDRQSSG
jgi:hypothetical protein